MKDREKQIEEMAEIALKNTMSYTCAKQIAMNFYEQGYRKIDKDSVVLSREEAERFRGQTINIAKVKAEERKETAKKIYRELQGHGTTHVKKWIEKQFNIEIKEG